MVYSQGGSGLPQNLTFGGGYWIFCFPDPDADENSNSNTVDCVQDYLRYKACGEAVPGESDGDGDGSEKDSTGHNANAASATPQGDDDDSVLFGSFSMLHV